MVNGPQPDRLEFAVLKIVMTVGNGSHQNPWPVWFNAVKLSVPDLTKPEELQAAFTRLRKQGHLRLTKWHTNAMQQVDFSGKQQDEAGFFYSGDFVASITDTGRSHWGKLDLSKRDRVFISHITEEKAIAKVLQKHLNVAFGDKVPVFVSSDGKSITGGKKWYNHIIDNLRLSEIVLVLISQESKGREWINFEAGFGEGMESLVIPVAIKHMSVGQMSWPMAGIQARTIDDIGLILDDIGNRLGVSPVAIDAKAYANDIEEAEASLVYKSLKVEPIPDGEVLHFEIENVGNIDLELLMLEVHMPATLRRKDALPAPSVEMEQKERNGITYISYRCFSSRGAYAGIPPVLRPIITPSMGRVRPKFRIPVTDEIGDAEKEMSLFFKIHAIGYRTEEEERKIGTILPYF